MTTAHTPHITLVTGGQRSGKSEMAESLALEASATPLYLATATVNPADTEMVRRVEAHKARRGGQWSCIEEPLSPASHAPELKGRTVLVDCLTLWATNLFFAAADSEPEAFRMFQAEFDRLLESGAENLIFVTNEIGMGGISPNAMQRSFTDLQGRVNRLVASKAHCVYLMISGIPLKIK